jgi:uncharacterized membrane protein YtjA (UPF0391 family)
VLGAGVGQRLQPFLCQTDRPARGIGAHLRNGRVTRDEALQGEVMLYWAVVFFIIAIIAAVLGFGGIAASAAGIAKILFFIFLVIAVIAFVAGRGRVPPA